MHIASLVHQDVPEHSMVLREDKLNHMSASENLKCLKQWLGSTY